MVYVRHAKVCSISLPGLGREKNRLGKVLDRARKWIDLAAKDEPDIICLPESINGLGLGGEEWASCAEKVPGPTSEMASERAKEHSTYIICPLVRKDRLGLHNSAILLDRSGDPASVYDKVHPTIGEMECGVIPGERGVTHDTDFGRIGFAICFDLNFRDLRTFYARRNPEIIFFPSMYRGGIQLRLWAYELACYMVSATPGEQSAIINPLGRVLEESYQYNTIITRCVNLDFDLLHLDYNSEKFEGMKSKYGPGVEFEVASPEGIFLLCSNIAEKTSADIVKEFNLETRRDYFRRATRVRLESLAG